MSIQRKTAKVLWKQGPTTTNFVSCTLPFFKQSRFKLNSIYPAPQVLNLQKNHRKKSKKQRIAQNISRSIDMEQKNQIRMKSYKKHARKEDQNQKHTKNKSYGSMPQTKTIDFTPINLTQTSDKQIVDRLYLTNPSKLSKLRDRNGIRRTFFHNEEDQLQTKLRDSTQLVCKSKGFSTTRRINFKLPLSYYPGPGTYSLRRQFQQNLDTDVKSCRNI